MVDRAEDLSYFGLEREGDGRWAFDLVPALSRPVDGRLFGGAALAVSIVLGEVESDRTALWTTTQFIDGTTSIGDRVECSVEVLASGRNTAQLRVRGFVGDKEVFCSLGATGRPREDKPIGAFPRMAQVLPPEECPPHRFPGIEKMLAAHKVEFPAAADRIQEIRVATPASGYEPGLGELLLWTRARDRTATPAIIGYLADVVPMAIAKGLGRPGAGTSLDNTVRFGAVPGTDDWLLCQVEPHGAAGGYGHGVVHLWSRDGRLLATGSQTASLLFFD